MLSIQNIPHLGNKESPVLLPIEILHFLIVSSPIHLRSEPNQTQVCLDVYDNYMKTYLLRVYFVMCINYLPTFMKNKSNLL